MNRITACLLLLAAGFMLLFTGVTQAADISIGATSWYAWWDESIKKSEDPSIDPSILYGPVLAVGFSPKWSLTAVFLYGGYDLEMSDGTLSLHRYDSDMALNYSINRYMKLFGGVKFMGYDWNEGSHYGAGPAAGVGFTVPLAESLFLLWNVSGMYAFAKEKSTQAGFDYKTNAREPGVNTSLSLAYYIDAASTTVTLGGRYQWFRVLYDRDASPDTREQFYGLTLSAVYSFGK